MIEAFADLVQNGVSEDWPRRSLAAHRTMLAIFKSALNGGEFVTLK